MRTTSFKEFLKRVQDRDGFNRKQNFSVFSHTCEFL